jgi:hypothetical protein
MKPFLDAVSQRLPQPRLAKLPIWRPIWIARPQMMTSLGIFGACLLAYLLNASTALTSSDNLTGTLVAFNWLENQTLNFDAFREGYLYAGDGIPYFFVEAPNGHLTSRYPIGTALVTFPLYCLFFIYLKFASLVESILTHSPVNLVNVTSEEFGLYRRSFGKLAATLSSALSVVLFYLAVRLKFNQTVALLTTFTFAFATGTWVLCSQDLRQHTISNLLLISILLCLFKVERTTGSRRKLLFLTSGFFCGLLPGVRITSAIFAVMIAVYVAYLSTGQKL